ncbi:MAG: hypothetical protein IJ085_03345 [Turicibacter sp.]|nr:hypothetical protein [Turicibacter sp.]
MAYTKVNWQENTPINVENLNNMDEGIKALDDGKLDANSPCSRFSWQNITGVGARIVVDNAGNNAAVSFADSAANSTKINNMQVRGGSGLTGASGYITFSW